MVLIVILALAGVLFIALEVILPGMVLGIAGGIAIATSLVMTFTTSDLEGMSFGLRTLIAAGILLGSLTVIGIWLKYFDRTSIGRRLVLGSEIDGKVPMGDDSLVGTTGIAKTDLRPSGRVEIPGLSKSCDVIAETGFIERGSTIEVVKVDGRRIVVRGVSAA